MAQHDKEIDRYTIDKAIELYTKFLNIQRLSMQGATSIFQQTALSAAKTCVDEILKVAKHEYKYWAEVRNALEYLSHDQLAERR